ncbi:MAG: TonB-dependent receptor [Flavobacteriales bacterium]
MGRLLLFFLLPSYTIAQTLGIVTNENNQPLSGVEVIIMSTATLVETDDKGTFSIDNSTPKRSVLYFSKEGYKSQTIPFVANDKFEITLSELHVNIDEVEVSSINNKLSSNQTLNIQSKKMTQLNASSFNLVESLSKISGVEQQTTGNGIQKVVVRGLSGTRVVTLMNGTRIENQQWGTDHGIGVTDLGIGKVELVKGPASIIFGADALGGALYLSDESFNNNKPLETKIITQFESASMLINNQIGLKWSNKAIKNNTLIEYGSVADYRLPDKTYLFNSRYSQMAFKTALGYNTDKWVMNLRYQYNQNTMGIPAHSHDTEPTLDQLTSSSQNRYPTRPTQFNALHLLNIENSIYFSNSTLKVILANSNNRLEEFEAWTVPEIDVYLNSSQLNLLYSKPLSKYLKWTIGSQSGLQLNLNQPARTQLIANTKTTDLGLYSLLEYSSKSHLSSQIAIRIDNRKIDLQDGSFSKDYKAISLSLGLAKQWEEHHVRMSYSSAFRTPHFYELLANGVHHATRRYEIGDKDLNIEKGNQIDFSYEWTGHHLGFIINPFYHSISDFITLNPLDSTIKNVPVFRYEQLDNVELKGVELNIHFHPHFAHQLHFDIGLSLLEGKSKDGNFLSYMPANNTQSTVRYLFSKRHKKMQLKTVFMEHAFHMAQQNTAINEKPSEAYHLVDGGLTFSFYKNPLFNLTLGVKNIFNESYVPHLSNLKPYIIPNQGRSYFIKLITNL